MIYKYNGQIIAESPNTAKLRMPVELNDENEVLFIKTYGVDIFELWKSLSEEQKKVYKNFENKVEQVCSVCSELFTQYHTDLEYYALMYRNIPLYHLALDAYSMLFFASKKDEIIGYHTRILNSCSDKSEIVKLYYDNKALFPKACKKHLNIDLLNDTIYSYNFTEEIIQNFNNNHIPTVKCVDALSPDDCKAILKAKQQLQNEYKDIFDKAPWLYDRILCKYQQDFQSLSLEKIKKYSNIIDKFLVEHGMLSFETVIDKIKLYEEKKTQLIKEKYILPLAEKISVVIGKKQAEEAVQKCSSLSEVKVSMKRLNKSIQQELERSIEIDSIVNSDFIYGSTENRIEKYENWIYRYEHCPEQRSDMTCDPNQYSFGLGRKNDWRYKKFWEMTPQDIREKNEYEKMIDDAYVRNKITLQELRKNLRLRENQKYELVKKIETLKKEIQNIIGIIDKTQEEVYQFAESTDGVKIIRNNSDVINTYLNHSLEAQYNELWLLNKNIIRYLEANSTREHSFVSFIEFQDRILKNIERRKTINRGNVIRYSPSFIFTKWYAPIKEKKERLAQMEQMRRDEELRREKERLQQEIEQRKYEEEARQAQFRYNQRNKYLRDDLLSFNKERHTYMVNGKVLDSVTSLVTNSFPKFDTEEQAKHVASRNGMDIQEVIEMWEKKGKQSREQGTLLHEKIEKYYQGIDSPDDPAFQLFKQFARKITLKPYRTEWGVYDNDLGIAGSIDFVDCQNGEYSIYDWKRSDKLVANGLPVKNNKYGEKGNYPFEHLDNSPYYHYALQLSIYKYILERNYGIKVVHLRLGIFHPSYVKPYLLEMPYLGDEVNCLFNLRSEIIL